MHCKPEFLFIELLVFTLLALFELSFRVRLKVTVRHIHLVREYFDSEMNEDKDCMLRFCTLTLF